MKLLFTSDVPLKNPTSGSEQVLYHHALGLRSAGHDVWAITRNSQSSHTYTANVEGVKEGSFYAGKDSLIHFAAAHLKIPPDFFNKFNKSGGFDAIICHQPFTCFSLILRKKIKDIPILYVFHSPSHEEYLEQFKIKNRVKNFFPATIRYVIEKICIKQANKYMTLSAYMKGKLKKIHRIPESLIVVNPGGVDIRRFKPIGNRDQIKKELDFPDGKIHLITIRNLEPRMGLDNLVKSIRILKNNKFNIHLTIGGEGPERNHLENLIKGYHLTENIALKGFISNRLLPKYYCAADFFILPTRRLEGFGLITPESMACGTPVLGTPVGGTKEILKGFNSEFLFKDTSPKAISEGIGNTVEKYFHIKEKYEILRTSCRSYAEKNYSWEKHISTLINTTNQMISE